MRALAALLTSVLMVAGAACVRPRPAAERPNPDLTVTFRGLWWSEEEMVRIPASKRPVPKTKEVVLTSWDASDPIGSPHPDVVDVAGEVSNPPAAPSNRVRILVSAQWKIGPPGGESSAQWKSPEAQPPSQTLSLGPGEHGMLRVPLGVAAKLKALAKSDRYAWNLRVKVDLVNVDSGAVLLSRQAELPIYPGD